MIAIKGSNHGEELLDADTLTLIHDSISRFPGFKLAYLFGSQVEGRTGPLSDYDFGVLMDRSCDGPGLRGLLAHLLGDILGTDRVDVVLLHRAPVELAFAIISQGELVYQRDDATRVDYEADIMGLYGDFLPVLRSQRQDIHRGGEHATRVQRHRAAFGRTERTLGEIRAAQGKATG